MEYVKGLAWSRNGTAAVEFAMVLPLVLMLLFAGIEIGRLLTDFHAVNKSVRDAARYLARVELNCPGVAPSSGPLASYIANGADETIARNLAMTGAADNPAASTDYLLRYWTDTSTVSTTVNCIANTGQYEGVFLDMPLVPQITMTAAVPFNFMWGDLFIGMSSITMTVKHTETSFGS
jgi:Flp pilus assembly protein TadG